MAVSFFNRRQFILSCLASTLLPQAIAVTSGDNNFNPFSFAFISDCHLTAGKADNFMLLQESQLFLQDVIKQLNLIKPDFVIFGGDQTQGIGEDDANWQLFLDIVQSLDCPWHFVLGETDVSGYMPINKMLTYGRDWKGRGLNNDKPYWSYDPIPGIHLIGLDTSQANSTTGDMEQTQLDWLELDLQRQDNPFTIVISHHPILAPAISNKADAYLLPQAAAVRAILEKSKKRILSLSGHMHMSKIQCHNNIWYISSSSLDVYPCAFRFFKVTPQQIEVQTYQVSFPALIKKAKANLLSSSFADSFNNNHPDNFVRLAAGSRVDQNAILSLKEAGVLEVQKTHIAVH